MVRIENKPIIAGSVEVSSKVFDGGIMRTTEILTEVGDLVSHIVNVASHDLIKEVGLSDNGAVVEPMVEGRR